MQLEYLTSWEDHREYQRPRTNGRFTLEVGSDDVMIDLLKLAIVRHTLLTASSNASVGTFTFSATNTHNLTQLKYRNQQVIKAARSALASPRTPSFKLIECEFPAVAALNKLGDGSLRSANEVDDANLATAKAIVQSISSVIPGLGPAVWLLTSTAAGPAFIKKATESTTKVPSYVHNLKEGLPAIKSRDVCVLVAPCNSQDYAAAQRLAINGNAVILVNGFAKDLQSVPGAATMAYFLKPLTYNSQIAGYLIRCYPGPWTVVDAATGSTLSTCLDETILVAGTNTPDLRAAVKLVQRAVDERAIRARALPK